MSDKSKSSKAEIEIFNGRLTIAQAIEKLRARLLDLSTRNRFLNFKHPRGKCIQFAGNLELNLVFEKLMDEKKITIQYVKEPDLLNYGGKRPEARDHAENLGISTSYEAPRGINSKSNIKTLILQALFYPTDLEKLLRKIRTEAKSAIEETGSNMLFLIFGFLEFYESDDSDKPMIAPLLSVPVMLRLGDLESSTGTYQYDLQHNGEDVVPNRTLYEKVRREFGIQLPNYEDDQSPESYFLEINKVVSNKRRWKVRNQLSLGMLSFGKLALYDAMDPDKYPEILENNLVKTLMKGGNAGDGRAFAEDYRVDEHELNDIPLIFESDSSQQSAVIDVFSGKNLVINGPPGTGKSQTITNIIAATLSAGKKVLFVSEKLAALEVVQRRLDKAGLGDFCLELHSNKTQKKQFLENISTRRNKKYKAISNLDAKIKTLRRQQSELSRYAEIMGSKFGNSLGLTVNDVFWSAELRRQSLGSLATALNSISFRTSSSFALDDVKIRSSILMAISLQYEEIGQSYGLKSPWWGLNLRNTTPSDHDFIASTIFEAFELPKQSSQAVSQIVALYQLTTEPSVELVIAAHESIERLPPMPGQLCPDLLQRFFSNLDPIVLQEKDERFRKFSLQLRRARQYFSQSNSVLNNKPRNSSILLEQLKDKLRRERFIPSFLGSSLKSSSAAILAFSDAIDRFEAASKVCQPQDNSLDITAAKLILRGIAKVGNLQLSNVPISILASRTETLSFVVQRLREAFVSVRSIAERNRFAFSDSPQFVNEFGNVDNIPDLIIGGDYSERSLVDARQHVQRIRINTSIADLRNRRVLLSKQVESYSMTLERCRQVAMGLGVFFDGTEESLKDLSVLLHVCSTAPIELLDYRTPHFGKAQISDAITLIEQELEALSQAESSIAIIFHIDLRPSVTELRRSAAVLGSKDGFFGLLSSEWRKAKATHLGMRRGEAELSAKQRATELAMFADYIERREAFVSNTELKLLLGGLFKGLATDSSRMRSLNDWYLQARRTLATRPGLNQRIDVTRISREQVEEISAIASGLISEIALLFEADQAVTLILDQPFLEFTTVKNSNGWLPALEILQSKASDIKSAVEFFETRCSRSLSPAVAVQRMEARAQIAAAQSSFQLLRTGPAQLTSAGGDELHGITNKNIDSWPSALDRLESEINEVQNLLNITSKFASEGKPLSVAENLAHALLELNSAWNEVVVAPELDQYQTSEAIIQSAKTALASANDFVTKLLLVAESHNTIDGTLAALDSDVAGQLIVNQLSTNDEITADLENYYCLLDTDLELIESTISWGWAVVTLEMPTTYANQLITQRQHDNQNYIAKKLFEAIRKALLSLTVEDEIIRTKELLAKVRYSFENIVSRLNEIGRFGEFSWNAWLEPIRGSNKTHLATEILRRLDEMLATTVPLQSWVRYQNLRLEAKNLELTQFVDLLERGIIPPTKLADSFEYTLYRSIGRDIFAGFPELTKFNSKTHDRMRNDYQALDREIISLMGSALAYKINHIKSVPIGSSGALAGDFTEDSLLQREINKQKRHIPIRELVRRAGRALQEYKPCFMMGPLSVAQYIQQGALEFDLVVMDEASQLRPEEAIVAMARGKQLVVVGDPKQLPPTSFFDRIGDGEVDEEEDTAAASSGMESILDICQQIFTPVRSLRWHYRSHHESLIAFSNHFFYKNLIIFPSPFPRTADLGVRYRFVNNGIYKDRRNVAEAHRVVESVLEHVLKYPDQSLGIVTLNQTQRDLIEELLDKKFRTFSEASGFVDRWESEGWPFFIKNLENVQGDERDVIFISTTFGKAVGTQSVKQNFGPISRSDGWRRLNVLFTRSRKRIELFTSMSPEDIVVDQNTPLGTKVLRDYLAFAKTGLLVTTDEVEREPDSDFEISVSNVITSLGYEVKPQLGVAGYFIDIAVRNPDRRGEFLAGIECDGATYHSALSARDRDRIRQEILEAVGWKGRIYRIWSTDWFYQPQSSIEKLAAFLSERRRISQLEPSAILYDDELDFSDSWTDSMNDVDQIVDAVGSEFGDASDLFVEVGDKVVYSFIDEPTKRISVTISEGPSNLEKCFVNENMPLARALLGLSVGEMASLAVDNRPTRKLQVHKIRRSVDAIQ